MAGKQAKSLPLELSTREALHLGKLLALPTNIRQDWNSLQKKNT